MKRPANAADENLTALEKRGLERGAEFVASGTAYALEHGTRPSTIGHVLASNPLAVLAWLVDTQYRLLFNACSYSRKLGVGRSISPGPMNLFLPKLFLNLFHSIG